MKHYPEVVKQYMTLAQALKCLPGVKPNSSKAKIEDGYESIWNPRSEKSFMCIGYIIGKTELSVEEYDEIRIIYQARFKKYIREIVKVGPEGAKILLKLYRNGDLEMQKGKEISDAPELKAYIDKAEFFKKENDKIRQREEHIKYLIEHPEEVKESEFTYYLLDEIFKNKKGLFRGSDSLPIGGIMVTKSVGVYKSNSGITQDSEVNFSWRGADKQVHVITKYSRFSGNRRNDPDRNWGLPE